MSDSEVEFQTIVGDLSRLKEIPSASQSAQFYKGADESGRSYVVKVFNSRSLFELELLALRSLGPTGRVCEVLYESSRSSGGPNDSSSKSLNCIVKPFYERLLTAEKNPIVLLDRCAQEADISVRLWEHRWRDLDGRFDNDAVMADGTVIRFDLDGCESYAFFEPKYTEQFHRAEHTAIRRKIQSEIREKLLTEDAEIDSLIIRVSRLLMRQFPNAWPSLEAVIQSREGEQPSADKKDKGGVRTATALADALLRPFGHKSTKAVPPRPSWPGVDRWLEEWSKGFTAPRGPGDTSTLSSEEAVVIGAMCYHILHNRTHGFRLQDIHESLLLVCAALVLRRFRALRETRQSVDSLAALVEQMPELKAVVRRAGPVGTSSPPASRVVKARTYDVQCRYGGGAWKAVKKGSDREVEDFVVGRASRPWILLLADGVSGGSGAQAIAILQSALQPWLEAYRPTSRAAAFEQVEGLISQVHTKLLSAATEGPCQTTLLIACIVESANAAPLLAIIRYGNSGFIVTHESEDQGGEAVVARSRFQVPSGFLGSTRFDVKADQQKWDVQMDTPGKYRLRAFSDGVAEGDERAEALVATQDQIGRLVERAADWPRETGAVGHDDWSVAGFDVQVGVKEDDATRGAEVAKLATKTPVPAGILDDLAKVPLHDFRLSEGARTFWTGLATSSDPRLRTVREFPLISSLAPALTGPAVQPVEVFSRAERADSGTRQQSDAGVRRSPKVPGRVISIRLPHLSRKGLFLVVALIVFALLGIRWLLVGPRTPQGPAPPEPIVERGTEPTQPSTPVFDNANQKLIYSELLGRRTVVLSSAPKGSGIDKPPLSAFLADLGEVLKKTDFEVAIEVHTDSYIKNGTPEQAAAMNEDISTKRGNAIVSWFKQDPALADRKIEAVGKGLLVPLVSPELTDADRDRNRRIVVRRTN
jgi:hypothetical protein